MQENCAARYLPARFACAALTAFGHWSRRGSAPDLVGTLAEQAPGGQKRPDAPQLAPYVPTPQEVVDRMLRLAASWERRCRVRPGMRRRPDSDCGGKRFGARGVGVDIDPQRIAEANANAKKEGVADRVTFRLQDALATDVSEATVVTLYLLSASNLKLRPILTKQLKPGARIVSHAFSMGDWQADKVDTFTDRAGTAHTVSVEGRREDSAVELDLPRRGSPSARRELARLERDATRGWRGCGWRSSSAGSGHPRRAWPRQRAMAGPADRRVHPAAFRPRPRAQRAAIGRRAPAAFYERGLARLDQSLARAPANAASGIRDPAHLYAEDLDLFGAGACSSCW